MDKKSLKSVINEESAPRVRLALKQEVDRMSVDCLTTISAMIDCAAEGKVMVLTEDGGNQKLRINIMVSDEVTQHELDEILTKLGVSLPRLVGKTPAEIDRMEIDFDLGVRSN